MVDRERGCLGQEIQSKVSFRRRIVIGRDPRDLKHTDTLECDDSAHRLQGNCDERVEQVVHRLDGSHIHHSIHHIFRYIEDVIECAF
jgi:hypothetical protein